ncbi:MAG: hypothetical protein OES46_06395 [Gammaproteobacteria bacterium]|nr:hypothetical protein [Gammaproteobacteria bacterium]
MNELIRRDRTLAQAAIQCVLAKEGVTVTLPRAVNRKELVENLGSLTTPSVSVGEMAKIHTVTMDQAAHRFHRSQRGSDNLVS